jgi:RNA polymerase sigma-70 factor (ECF subfamily)
MEQAWCEAGRRTGDERATEEGLLLHAGRAGDRDALDRLLAMHERALYALCRGIVGQAEEAEDAVQETFLRALRALPSFRGDAGFRTWLFRIAIHVCLKRKAVARRHPPPSDPAPPSPEAVALSQLRVREALHQLLPRQRVVLLLKEREGMSVGEIALQTGWSERQVRHELSKARQALAAWRQSQRDEGGEG